MYLRNLVVLAAAIAACQVDLVADDAWVHSELENFAGIDVVVKKKPVGPITVVHQTDPNGRVQFPNLAAGTYEITIRKPGGIAGLPVGSKVHLSGSASPWVLSRYSQPLGLGQSGIKALTAAAPAAAPVSVPLATGRMVLNPNATQSQLLALGVQSAVNDTLIDEEITLSAAATLDLQFSRADDPVPTTGLTFVVTEGTLQTLPQTIPIQPPEVGVLYVAVSMPPPTTNGPTITLTPNPLTVTPSATGILIVTLSPAAGAAGQVVNLSSSNTSIAIVPATVWVYGGATSATASVTGVAVGSATITASAGGFTSGTATVNVVNPVLAFGVDVRYIAVPMSAPTTGGPPSTPVFGVSILNPTATLQPGDPQPNIQVIAFPGSLKAGLYAVPLNVSIAEGSPLVISNNLTVPVNLLVVSSNTSLPPAVDQKSLVFTGPVGGTAAAQTIRVSNLEATAGFYTVNFVNSADAQYVSITPQSATLSSGQFVDVSVQPLPAAFLAAGVQDVRIAIAKQPLTPQLTSPVPQIVDVKLIAVPPVCRASQLIPVVVEAPNAFAGGLPSTLGLQVTDDCGNFAYKYTVRGQTGNVSLTATVAHSSRSNVRNNITVQPPPSTNNNPTLTLSVWGEDAFGNQFTGSNDVAYSLQSVSSLGLVRDVGSLAQSGDDLSTDVLNNVQPTGFAVGQSIIVTGQNLVRNPVSAPAGYALPTTLRGSQLQLMASPFR